MKFETSLACALACLCILSAGCHTGPHPAPTDVAAATGLNADEPGLQDSLFATHALAQGTTEMDAARLGIDRSQNVDLKLLAQRIFDDHARANDDLRLIVQQQSIPTEFDIEATEHIDSLDDASDSQFDRVFINHVMETRRDEIKNFKAAARNARNSDLREFASRGLPVLEEHLRIAENIAKNVGLDANVNEPAGANRPTALRDPFYGGDPQLPHQFNPVQSSIAPPMPKSPSITNAPSEK